MSTGSAGGNGKRFKQWPLTSDRMGWARKQPAEEGEEVKGGRRGGGGRRGSKGRGKGEEYKEQQEEDTGNKEGGGAFKGNVNLVLAL